MFGGRFYSSSSSSYDAVTVATTTTTTYSDFIKGVVTFVCFCDLKRSECFSGRWCGLLPSRHESFLDMGSCNSESSDSTTATTATTTTTTTTTVILGCGIIGLSTAYYLSESGNTEPSSICIVDSSADLFHCASGFAGGYLAADCM